MSLLSNPSDRPPKSVSRSPLVSWPEVDETAQQCGLADCLKSCAWTLSKLHVVVCEASCLSEREKADLKSGISHISSHLREPFDTLRADMMLRDN